MINRLGNPEPFFAEGVPLGEHAQFGVGQGERDTGLHGGQVHLTEALVAPCPVKG